MDLLATLFGPRRLWAQGQDLAGRLSVEFRARGGSGYEVRSKLVARALFWLLRACLWLWLLGGLIHGVVRFSTGSWRSETALLAFKCIESLKPQNPQCGNVASDHAGVHRVFCVLNADRSSVHLFVDPEFTLDAAETVLVKERFMNCPGQPVAERERATRLRVSYLHPDHHFSRHEMELSGTPAICLQHLDESVEKVC